MDQAYPSSYYVFLLSAFWQILSITPAAINYLADEGYDPEFGARPVKRAIQRCVLNDLSRRILADEVSREKPIVIDAEEQHLMFRN